MTPNSCLEGSTEKFSRMAHDKILDPENAYVANSALILILERGSSEDRVTWTLVYTSSGKSRL